MRYRLWRATLTAMACISLSAASGPSDAKLDFVRTFQPLLFAQGQPDNLPRNIAGLLNLNDGSSDYPICGFEWEDDGDKSLHLVEMGADKNGIVLAFLPSDKSYSLNWHLSENGQATGMVLVDKSGSHVRRPSDYASELSNELAYWRDVVSKNKLASDGPCANSRR